MAALAKADGYVLLICAGLDRMTLLHLAEKRSGRMLFRRWANGPDGKPAMLESGGCSEGFFNLEPALRPITRVAEVGGSTWQILPAPAALDIATHAIRRNQRITHCGADCLRCDDGVARGSLL
jgi:aminoglycoside 3-N-acetyltransferase